MWQRLDVLVLFHVWATALLTSKWRCWTTFKKWLFCFFVSLFVYFLPLSSLFIATIWTHTNICVFFSLGVDCMCPWLTVLEWVHWWQEHLYLCSSAQTCTPWHKLLFFWTVTWAQTFFINFRERREKDIVCKFVFQIPTHLFSRHEQSHRLNALIFGHCTVIFSG